MNSLPSFREAAASSPRFDLRAHQRQPNGTTSIGKSRDRRAASRSSRHRPEEAPRRCRDDFLAHQRAADPLIRLSRGSTSSAPSKSVSIFRASASVTIGIPSERANSSAAAGSRDASNIDPAGSQSPNERTGRPAGPEPNRMPRFNEAKRIPPERLQRCVVSRHQHSFLMKKATLPTCYGLPLRSSCMNSWRVSCWCEIRPASPMS